MMMRLWPCVPLLACLGGSLAVLASPTSTHDTHYAVTDLGALRVFPHSDWSQPKAVNDKGQVALNTRNGGQAYATVACLWDAGQTRRVTDFPAVAGSSMPEAAFPVYTAGVRLNTFPTGPWSEAFGLNNKGQVVGSYYTSVNPWSRAFVFEKGRMTLLATPASPNGHANGIHDRADGHANGIHDRANGINDAGQVVGWANFHDSMTHPYLWAHPYSQKPTALPTLGGKDNEPRAINAAGVAVGVSSLADGSQHAVVWERGKIRDIHPRGFTGSDARAINDKGQIVGRVFLSDGSHHACLWTAGKATDLGTLGGKNSQAEGISNGGEVVGDADIGTKVAGYNEVPHAFIWDAKNGLRDLNALIAAPPRSVPARQEFWGATGINSKGQIVVYQNEGHALLLTPISRR